MGNEGALDNYIKRAGPYLLGPKLGNSPVQCISHCLARKDGTDEFYTMKILCLKDGTEPDTVDDQQGKVLLHTEYSLLNLLRGKEGVVQHRGLFKDVAVEEVEENGKMVSTGRLQTRLCLVLDCYTPHDFCPKYTQLTNLQYYVIKEKRLSESEAIQIFYNVVQIVERLHQRNVVHRDLKLGNIILNKETREVVLTNFCLGKHLASDSELLTDQRGSPAYISPDVINGKPYLGKPSDMWALGVVLYTMLYGQFPFYDQSPSELFKKIKGVEYHIPVENNVSQKSIELIQSLLRKEPEKRYTSSQVLIALRGIMASEHSLQCDSNFQVVPDSLPSSGRGTKRPYNSAGDWKSQFNYGYDCEKSVSRRTSDLSEIEALLATASGTTIPNSDEKEDDDEEDNTVHQPPRKISKIAPRLGAIKITQLKDEPRRLTIGDLQKLHGIYLANKAKQACSPTPGPVDSPAAARQTTGSAILVTPAENSKGLSEQPSSIAGAANAADTNNNNIARGSARAFYSKKKNSNYTVAAQRTSKTSVKVQPLRESC